MTNLSVSSNLLAAYIHMFVLSHSSKAVQLLSCIAKNWIYGTYNLQHPTLHCV